MALGKNIFEWIWSPSPSRKDREGIGWSYPTATVGEKPSDASVQVMTIALERFAPDHG